MSIDLLIDKIREKRSPCCVGLDTRPEYLPPHLLAAAVERHGAGLRAAAEAVYAFNAGIIDAVSEIVPAVKLQCAHYDLLGPAGAEVMARTLQYAAGNGLYTIVDGKRNDVGLIAEAYAQSFFGAVEVAGESFEPYRADSLTVTAYPGTDGIKPFLKYCGEHSIFVQTRSSSKSAVEIQDMIAGDRPLYRVIASRVERWGADCIGRYGYSNVGAVAGATNSRILRELRVSCRRTFLLVPGYGAQGGRGSDVEYAFDAEGNGALVSASRSILLAWKNRAGEGEGYAAAAADAAARMKRDISAYVTIM